MRFVKDYWVHMLVVAVLLAVGAWIMVNTEWAQVDVPTPGKGEALVNPYYATEQLLSKLGGTVVKNPHLDELPPPHGRLIVSVNDLGLFIGREQRIKTWVEQGGHLVIPGELLGTGFLKGWLPIEVKKKQNNGGDDDDDDDDDEHQPHPASQASAAGAVPSAQKDTVQIDGSGCYKVAESPAVPARYPGQRDFLICNWFPTDTVYAPVQGRGKPLWQIDNRRGGTEAIRMPLGQGTVTVLDSFRTLGNRSALLGDDALLIAAALQAQRGAVFWFITEGSREGLLTWLWRRGGAAIVLTLLALALAVWRSAVRFGPIVRPVSINHRSMAEQVRGTGRFLRVHGSAALYAAQMRALHEAAAPRLKRYAQLDATARATAIAVATGLDRTALWRAMRIGVLDDARQSRALAAELELLERARRYLLAGTSAGASAGARAADLSTPSS